MRDDEVKCTRKGDVFELEIDGKTVEYPIRELPKEFVDWNLGHRVALLRGMLTCPSLSL